MSQTECKVLTIDARANTTISSVERKFRFPAIWYRRADRARQGISGKTGNYAKSAVFRRELNLLRDHLCKYARELFASLLEVANESGSDRPSDWAEAQTRARIAQIEKRSIDWPDEIANTYEDNLTCWVIVACSCRPVVAKVPGVHYQAPGWLVRWHPDSGTCDEPDWFSPEETEAIMANIRKWLSAEIQKSVETAKLEQGQSRVKIEEVEVIEPDYTKVKLRGKEFIQTKQQAKIVKVLHEELQKSDCGLIHTRAINLRIKRNPTTARISQAFRSHKNWKELIVEDGKGFYRLNVSMPNDDSPSSE